MSKDIRELSEREQLAWQKEIIKEEITEDKKFVLTPIRKRESKKRKFLRMEL